MILNGAEIDIGGLSGEVFFDVLDLYLVVGDLSFVTGIPLDWVDGFHIDALFGKTFVKAEVFRSQLILRFGTFQRLYFLLPVDVPNSTHRVLMIL
jgi:hypothetical protein